MGGDNVFAPVFGCISRHHHGINAEDARTSKNLGSWFSVTARCMYLGTFFRCIYRVE